MSKPEKIMMAAGGTGGHVFPALALAEALAQKHIQVHFVTDRRGHAYMKDYECGPITVLSAGSIFGGSVITLPVRALAIILGLLQASWVLMTQRPHLVVGFGGYPSLAPCLVARLLAIPVLVHEQNAVCGRANRLLARCGAYVATSFADTRLLPSWSGRRTRRTGNPVRLEVQQQARSGYRFLSNARPFDLLIFGGSQGAQVLNQVVPAALGRLSETDRRRLRVTHQVRREQMTQVMSAYHDIGVYAEIRDFFDDMPRRIRRAHLVISRAGASTVSELAAIGAPSILIPLAVSLDGDQTFNARALTLRGGAWIIPQSSLVPARLAARLERLMNNPDLLRQSAEAARSVGVLDATDKLVRYCLCLARREPVQIELPSHSGAKL